MLERVHMGLLDLILKKRGPKFTFNNHFDEERTMRAKDIDFNLLLKFFKIIDNSTLIY